MTVSICIGSSCHIKGSHAVVSALQELVTKHDLVDKVDLRGSFCMGKCQTGVNVTVDGVHHSVTPGNVEEFFHSVILAGLSE